MTVVGDCLAARCAIWWHKGICILSRAVPPTPTHIGHCFTVYLQFIRLGSRAQDRVTNWPCCVTQGLTASAQAGSVQHGDCCTVNCTATLHRDERFNFLKYWWKFVFSRYYLSCQNRLTLLKNWDFKINLKFLRFWESHRSTRAFIITLLDTVYSIPRTSQWSCCTRYRHTVWFIPWKSTL